MEYPKDVREAVHAFSLEMENELHRHDEENGYQGWVTCDGRPYADTVIDKGRSLLYFIDLANRNVGEQSATIRKLCADIGNYVMFIADNYGELRG